MASKTYTKNCLTGGTSNCLDSIDGAVLSEGDRAMVATGTKNYFYYLDATSGLTETGISVIAPDTNPDLKRWILTSDVALDGLYPDYSATDQGLTGNNNTVKYYVDLIGSNQGKIVLRHNSGSATTTYTQGTDLVLPSNITVKIEPGAILSITSGKTLTIYCPDNIKASKNQQIFDCAVDGVKFTTAGYVAASWFGFFTTATGTSNRTHLVSALTSNTGNYVYIGAGTFDLDTTTGVITPSGNNKIIGLGYNNTVLNITSDNNVFVLGQLSPQISDLKIDTTTISYTSRLITIGEGVAYSPNAKLLDGLVLYGGIGTSAGTAIYYHDDDGTGITNTLCRDIYIRGFTYGILQRVDNSASYINNNVLHGIRFFKTRYWIWQDRASFGTIRSNDYFFFGNGSSDSISAIHVEDGGNNFESGIYDRSIFNDGGSLVYDLRGVGAFAGTLMNTKNTVKETNSISDMRQFMRCDNPLSYRIVQPNQIVENYLLTGALPVWLPDTATDGTGATGISLGTSIKVTLSGGSGVYYKLFNNVNFLSGAKNPWLTYRFRFPSVTDYTKRIFKAGFFRDTTTDNEFLFVADPDNTLGTGIVGNWIFRTVDAVGTVTNTDTGVAFTTTSTKTFSIQFYDGGKRVRASIDRDNVADITLGSASVLLTTYFYTELTNTIEVDYQITDILQLSSYLNTY